MTTVSPRELDALRASLSARLPWTPLDFLRELRADEERSREAGRLTAALPESDDFRFVAQADDGTPVVVLAERLPWDSAFFGYDIARLNGVHAMDAPYDAARDLTGAIRQLLDNASGRGIRYLFAMVDPRDLALLRALGANGFASIETRVHFHATLQALPRLGRFPVRFATADDVPLLARTARDAVNVYDRFHADPFISRATADRLMEQWVRASVTEGFADAVLVPDHPDPEALVTIRYHREHWSRWGTAASQVPFTAVGPPFRGWFIKLMSEALHHFREQGVAHAWYTTQVTNGAVVHVLTKLGFAFGRVDHVFRRVL